MTLKPLSLLDTLHDVEKIARTFGVQGTLIEGGAFGNGLINDTLVGTFEHGGEKRRYVLQRINHEVFTNPLGLMQNVERVCEHVHQRLVDEGVEEIERRALVLLRTEGGEACYHDEEKGHFWRCYDYIDHCTSYGVVRTEEQAYEAARKFGEFQKLVADLPSPRLIETIPHFHDTPQRFQALEDTIAADPCDRLRHCEEEVAFARERKHLASHLLKLHQEGLIPERVTHNDTKLANVLICDMSARGMCVVDLDTVMPGLSLYDFGDLVRTCVSPGEEDTKDLSTIYVRLPIFKALVRGFIEELGDILTPAEKTNLAFSGNLLTFEVGLRFLTDYLLGDVYFGTKRPEHNIDRCRTQFRLVQSMEENQEAMNAFADGLAGEIMPDTRFSLK